MISFIRQQIDAIGDFWTHPGRRRPGPVRTYRQCAVPCSERIAAALGGVTIHACSDYEAQGAPRDANLIEAERIVDEALAVAATA